MLKFFKPSFQVVEVEAPRKPQAITEDLKQSVLSLSHHPGFMYLLTRLRYERSLLETTLKRTRHTDIREVDFLQSGIAWAGWLDDFLSRLVTVSKRSQPTSATPEEIAAFSEAIAAIEQVGS